MEIIVKKEDLGEIDTGGGCREVSAIITVDKSQSPRLQRQAVIYETLAALLPVFPHETIFDLTNYLGEALDQL